MRTWCQESDLPTETTLQPTPILTLRQSLIHPPSEWPNWTKRPFFFVHFLLASRPSFSCLAIMADAPVDALLKGSSGKNTRGLLRIIILFTIAAAAVSSRLFSVIRMFLGTRILREMQLRVQLTELLIISTYQVSRVSSMNVCVSNPSTPYITPRILHSQSHYSFIRWKGTRKC